MPNLDALILTAADYKVLIIINGKTFPLLTLDTIGQDTAREQETVYAIGTEQPIAEKRNGVKYGGKLTIQVGEIAAILQLCGLKESTQITGATLAVAAVRGGFSRVYAGMNINTENIDIKAKDKQTVANLDWAAVGVV